MNWSTHVVSNTVPALRDVNLFSRDLALQEALRYWGADAHWQALHDYGALLGSGEVLDAARAANANPPQLHTHDPQGHRLDQVSFHPGWHTMMRLLRAQGLASQPFSDTRPGAWAAYAAGFSLHGQVEAGTLCPAAMTFAGIALLRHEPELFGALREGLFSHDYDARDLPAHDKQSLWLGMGMTEKQGGSDVRSNQTVAMPIGLPGRGQPYTLVGHKWFFSAPMCDAHLVIARVEDGLSCFYVPRFLPDGSRNAVRIQRLKDKLGNRSNASAEVEFQDASGWMVGPEGQGIRTILQMAAHTRLNCVMGSAGLMRQALSQALHHCRHRQAFGSALADKPLMQNVLADLALESEAATWLMMRLAQAFACQDSDALSRAYVRLVTPAAKLWVCKRAVAFCAEAMEVLGGNGYVEDGPLAHLLREAPVNAIWEGSGNVMALDMLRAARDADSVALLLADLAEVCEGEAVLRQAWRGLQAALVQPPAWQEAMARELSVRLVVLVQACLMRRHAPAISADAFIASRLDMASGGLYGLLPAQLVAQPDAVRTIMARAWPD